MRFTLVMALWALSTTPLLAQAEVSNQEKSDWWKAPNVLTTKPSSEPPSLQTSSDNESLDLLPSDGWFTSGKSNEGNSPSEKGVPSTTASQMQKPLPVAPKANALPPASRGSVLTQAPLAAPTPGVASPQVAAPSTPTKPVRTNFANAPVAHENPFMPLGPSAPSPLLNYMQCTQCSPCLWSGYEAQQAAATARRMRHVNRQCDCFTQYFGNVIGGDCGRRSRFNRYAPQAAIGCGEADCGCAEQGNFQAGHLFNGNPGAGEGRAPGCGCGHANGTVAPPTNPPATSPSDMLHPQSRNINSPQRIAVPSIPAGKVANRPTTGSPF